MTIIDSMTATKKAAAKTAPKKPKAGAWIAKAKVGDRKEDGRLRPKIKADDLALPPGSTFRFEEVNGNGVVMAARVPSTARGTKFAVPPSLERQVHKATAGLNRTTALVALADYALDRLEQTPGTLTITPDEDRAGEGKRCCSFDFSPGRRLSVHQLGPLHGYPRDKNDRTRISVPEDVRARVEKHRVGGSFSGTVLALAQWALDDLRARKKQLIVSPANQG